MEAMTTEPLAAVWSATGTGGSIVRRPTTQLGNIKTVAAARIRWYCFMASDSGVGLWIGTAVRPQ